MEEKYLYFSIISLLVLIFVVFAFISISKQNKLENQISFLDYNNQQKENLISQLQGQKQELSGEKQELQTENQELSQDLDKLKVEAYNTIKEIEEFENRIKNSLEWFNENSNINYFDEYHSIERDLKNDCVNFDEDICEIKLSCLNYVNNEENEFSYQKDEKDHLLGLEEIYKQKGGDCEDYSTLAMAELNYLIDYCDDNKMNETLYIAFKDKDNKKHYVEFSENYYIEDAQDYEFYLKDYYVVCGNFIDVGGHCLLGFSDIPINVDVYRSLKNAILIEPQTGEIKYDLRRDTVIKVPKKDYIEDFYIYLVYDNEDMYLFNLFGDEYKWMSYSNFATEVEDLKQNLQNFI